jgi:glycosyltransferase involved in cell wall biosynthesis
VRQIHLLSFEGPDPYAQAGGIGTRVSGLVGALSAMGFETHLWFVGDPQRPGHESRGNLHLHRWCQWISRHHPNGVYAGEEAKVEDYGRSLPPWLADHLKATLGEDGRAVVIAEEWQTASAVLHLDALLRARGMRERVSLLWNANNTFGFETIDWGALSEAAAITTVSRYMLHLMRAYGVHPAVIPNGLSPEAFGAVPDEASRFLRERLARRTLLAKVARFDPDKRWLSAIGITSRLKRAGLQPLLVARGGLEPYGRTILDAARAAGLRVVDRAVPAPGARGLCGLLEASDDADVLCVTSHLDWDARRLLFRESAVVLANSGHEPFGLVGLETMAVGGMACTGCSGEDYAVPGHNALVVQTDDPDEFVALFRRLRAAPEDERAIRSAGRETARQYAWPGVIRRTLLPRAEMPWARG